jgi:hypothetical protein
MPTQKKPESTADINPKKQFIYTFSFSVVLIFIFWVLFTIIYYFWKDTALLSSKALSPETLKYFADYGKFAWAFLFIISFIELAIFYLLRFIFWLRKYRLTVPLLCLILFKLWAYFGYVLLYQEPRNTPIASAIIDFFWKPFFYAWGIMAIYCWIWFLILLIRILLKK